MPDALAQAWAEALVDLVEKERSEATNAAFMSRDFLERFNGDNRW